MMMYDRSFPIASARDQPNVDAAFALQSATRPCASIPMNASSAVSRICRYRCSVERSWRDCNEICRSVRDVTKTNPSTNHVTSTMPDVPSDEMLTACVMSPYDVGEGTKLAASMPV